jgi:exopolysaccharide biosynthesis protein
VPPVNAAHARGLYTAGKVGSGVYYRKGTALRVGINVIEADLNDPEVRVGAMIAQGGIGSAERFGQMVQRARPAAAITGTFFGMRNLIPTGDLVINGRSVFRGFIGTAVAITEGNIVSFIPTRYKDQAVDWSHFDTVIRGGPRLVDSGIATMTARSEGFRSLPVSARRTRTAVGLTRDNRLQFVAVRQGITLWELAKVMRAIGAYHAVALDGGTSTAMYFAGRYIARPGRGLTNVLMIYHRRDRYEAMRHEFAGSFTPRPEPSVPVIAGAVGSMSAAPGSEDSVAP